MPGLVLIGPEGIEARRAETTPSRGRVLTANTVDSCSSRVVSKTNKSRAVAGKPREAV